MVLSERYGVELPICRAVYDVLFRKQNFSDTIEQLFARTLKHELR